MRRNGFWNWSAPAALSVLAIAAASPLAAQMAIIQDINSAGDSNPAEFIHFAGSVYFVATSAESGRELWKTDGVTAELVADINPGSASSNPEYLTISNNVLYFAANDGSNGTELWRSDGTTAGTVLASNVRPGANGSNPMNLVDAGGVLYFSADLPASGRELYSFDGTTLTLHQLRTGTADSDPEEFLYNNGILFFRANNGTNGTELWKVQGGTPSLVKDIRSGSNSSLPQFFAALGTGIVFSANDGTNGTELWYSDGTSDNTYMIENIAAGGLGSDPQGMTTFGSTVVFSANLSSNGRELWVTDGSSASLVADILPGILSSSPQNFYAYNGLLYFSAQSSLLNTEPFVYDGSTVTALGDLNSLGGSDPAEFVGLGSNVYFAANELFTGRELWVTQGTEATTMMVQDIGTGIFASSQPRELYAAGGVLFFAAEANTTQGHEPWSSAMGNPLLVVLNEARATAPDDHSQVTISWSTASEIDTTGFLVYRVTVDGSRTLVSDGLVPAFGSPDSGASYEIVDSLPLQGPEDHRMYALIDVDLSGVETQHGLIPVRTSESRSSSVEGWALY